MNNVDKICKEVLNVFSFSKDQAIRAIVTEKSNEGLSLSEQDLEKVIAVVSNSLEDSFQKGFSKIYKSVEEIVQIESSKKNK